MNNDDISHFSTIPASFAMKSNVYFITHQYLIINNSQSQRALSVSVCTVLWIYFASRRNCGLLPQRNNILVVSHLCHQTLCVKHDHLVLESKALNNERKHCLDQGLCTENHKPVCIL